MYIQRNTNKVFRLCPITYLQIKYGRKTHQASGGVVVDVHSAHTRTDRLAPGRTTLALYSCTRTD